MTNVTSDTQVFVPRSVDSQFIDHSIPLESTARPAKLLIIEDDRDITEIMKVRLESAGYRTAVAEDGLSGLQAARSGAFRAVILDVRLPKLDGLAVLRELKTFKRTRSTPVIVVSASLDDRKAALNDGADSFINKPFDASDLLAAVATAVQHSQVNEKRYRVDTASPFSKMQLPPAPVSKPSPKWDPTRKNDENSHDASS